MNLLDILARGENVKTSFKLADATGTYSCRVQGVPDDFTSKAMATLLEDSQVNISTRREVDGKPVSSSSKADGTLLVPFFTGEPAPRKGKAKSKSEERANGTMPAPSANGQTV